MVATTATKAPVIAVVDYSYKRHGVTIIPAGSRIIGAIGAASSTGIMDIQFNSIHLPNGEDVSINAMGLNTQMGPIKGVVSGRNRSKEFLLATVAGLGGITAQFAGNNTSGALSEGDLIRSQTSTNLGSAADAGIGELAVKEHIVVTVAAGTQVEVTFTTAIKAKKPTVM
jgi:type IV secretory pathway VirB10-like protein